MILGNIMVVRFTIFDATYTDWNHYGTSDCQMMVIDEMVLSTTTDCKKIFFYVISFFSYVQKKEILSTQSQMHKSVKLPLNAEMKYSKFHSDNTPISKFCSVTETTKQKTTGYYEKWGIFKFLGVISWIVENRYSRS